MSFPITALLVSGRLNRLINDNNEVEESLEITKPSHQTWVEAIEARDMSRDCAEGVKPTARGR